MGMPLPASHPGAPSEQPASSQPPPTNPTSLWGTLTDAFAHLEGAPLLVFVLATLAILLMAGVMWTAETLRVLTVPFVLIVGGGLIGWVILERKKVIAKTGSATIVGSVTGGSQVETGGIEGEALGTTGSVVVKRGAQVSGSTIKTGSIKRS